MGFLDRLFRKDAEAGGAGSAGFGFGFGIADARPGALRGSDATSRAAMDMIASSMGSLSGEFHDADTKMAAKGHPIGRLLRRPNPDETRFQFMHSCVGDYFLSGNVYIYKYDNQEGETVALFRLNPDKVRVRRDGWKQKVYAHEGREYRGDKILHVPSRYGYDGIKGRSILSECARAFELSAELDDYVNNSFNNGVGNRVVIDVTKSRNNSSAEDAERIKEMFVRNYAGVKNAGKPVMKFDNIEYSTLDTEARGNRANQLLENRQHQEREMAKLFGIPLPLLSGAETSNIESLYILYIENAIRPIATQFEQSINTLLPLRQRERLYYEYSYNSLLKTSLSARINGYARQLTNAVLSPNEIRRKENLPEVEGGDTLFLPSNLMPLRPDVIDAYMAGAKLKLAEMNAYGPGVAGNHSAAGDDKGA